jgi:predicted nucleic acid-binding protein
LALARAGGLFVDTSVLIGGFIDFGPAAGPAQRLMDAVAARKVRDPHTAWHCCLEFYSVSTRLPEEYRLTPSDALRLLEEEVLGRFRVHQLPDAARLAFLRSAEADAVSGGRVYDAHIAAIARHAGVGVIVTDNVRHFVSLRDVRVATPKEFLDALGP